MEKKFLKSNIKNKNIVLRHNYKIGEIEKDNDIINVKLEIEDKDSLSKQYDILEITNAVKELGRFFNNQLSNVIKKENCTGNCMLKFRETIILDKYNITKKIQDRIISFLEKYNFPYNASINQSSENKDNKSFFSINIVDFIKDSLVIYHIMRIITIASDIKKEANSLKDYSEEEKNDYIKESYKFSDISESIYILMDILNYEIEKKNYFNTNNSYTMCNNVKPYYVSATNFQIKELVLKDLLNYSENWISCNVFFEKLITTARLSEHIGNINVNNILYDIKEKSFLSYLMADSLIAIAYYGVSMKLMDMDYTIGICKSINCFNLFKRVGNRQQCIICEKNNELKKARDIKNKHKKKS